MELFYKRKILLREISHDIYMYPNIKLYLVCYLISLAKSILYKNGI